MRVDGPDDWRVAPNIASDPATYELENAALLRDGRLDEALYALAPWDGRTVVDIGCGTGFWLPIYGDQAGHVIGVEPDPALLQAAARRVAGAGIDVRRGSAEHLPIADRTVDIAHARFAYFFGVGAQAGLVEVARVLARDGVLLVVDNSWRGGDFARLLRAGTAGNAAHDSDETDRWWAERGAIRHEVVGGWAASTTDELDRILRIEFADEVVDAFMARHDAPALSYHFAVYEWQPQSV